MRLMPGAYLCSSLVALTAVAYLPLWDNTFVNFDDEPYLASNPRLLQGMTGAGVRWAWTNDEATYWMPVTWLSFLFDAQFFPAQGGEGDVTLSPVACHAQNLFWHAASVILLFLLLNRLTHARWRSLFVSALFAVHPMHVESVAWAMERKDVLSVFFGILTLWMYARYVECPSRGRYLAVAGVFVLSLLSKPMLITLPFVLLILDYWPLRRMRPSTSSESVSQGLALRTLVREKGVLFVLAGLVAVMTLISRDRHGALVSLSNISLADRLANALAAYGWYLSTTLYPNRLAALYPHPYGDWSLSRVLAGALALVVVFALCWRQRQQQPWLMAGWLWFVLTLLPMTGLAQGGAQAWADRFSYWPHIGLFIALVWGIGEWVDRFRIPSLLAGTAGGLILAALATQTFVQVGYWRTSDTLWEHTLAVTEDNDRAHQYLAISYYKQGLSEQAIYHSQAAWQIQLKRLRSARR